MRVALGSRSSAELRSELLLWRSGAVIFATTVAIGALQGVLWSRIAPGEQFFVNPNGQFGALSTESYHRFTDIAIFALIGLVVAVSLGTVTWQWRSVRGVSTVLVLAGANGLGALTAYLLGRVLAGGVDPASVGPSNVVSVVNAAPTLGSALVIVVQPAIAAAVYTFLVAWNGRPDLARPEERSPAGVSAGDPPETAVPETPISTGSDPWVAPVPVRAWSVEDG